MKTINGPLDFRLPMANGDTSYPGYNVWGADTGIASWKSPVQPYVTFVNFGASQPTRPMPANAPYMSVLTDQWLRYFVARDPKFDAVAFDPAAPGAWANRLQEISALLDASTDISAFKARGGKLLLAHGLVDVVVSSRATEQYYQRLQSQMGAAQVDTFVRFYEVAGYGHAGSSVFNASWDSLTAIDRWSVDGTAPERQIVTDAVGVPGRTRPLCDYPKWPKYVSGNVDQAASFRCAE
jgi:feruloyl esterase